jgi:hypothetical protein
LLITAYIITGLKKLDANFIYNTSTEAAWHTLYTEDLVLCAYVHTIL